MLIKCPGCVQTIHRAADACPHCGFALADAEEWFGGRELNLRCLADMAGLLRHDERERVETALEEFRRSFPQLFVAIYTGAFGEVAALRPFGFWLLNRAHFEDLPPGTIRSAGILLTIDPESKTAGMTFGYLLDPYLEEADTFDCLARAHSHWLEGRFADGMLKALAQLGRVLRKRSHQARRNPARFERKVRPPTRNAERPRPTRDDFRPAAAVPPADPQEGPR